MTASGPNGSSSRSWGSSNGVLARLAGDLLAGKVALVTGGGTNLGKAAAELARCDAAVVIARRREDVLEAASRGMGKRSSWVTGDIRERQDAEGIVRAALKRHCGHAGRRPR